MSDKFIRLIEKSRGNKAIHELAICAENNKAGTRASGFIGKLGGEEIGPDTPYFIASATKLFVTALIMQLLEKKMLDLNSPITDFFVPGHLDGLHVLGKTDYTANITVENLLAHTSGLPDYFEQKQPDGTVFLRDLLREKDRSWNVDDVIKMVKSGMKPAFAPSAPGRAFYSDTNFQLLGAIIERVSGLSFADAIEQSIATPLGLENTYVFEAEAPATNKKVIPLRYGAKQLAIPRAMASVTADGGIVSTAADGLTFIKAFWGGILFPKTMLGSMTARWNRIFFPLRYGTGIMLFRLPPIMTLFKRQPDLIGHSGISGAFIYVEPENEIFISGTVNQLASRSLPYKVMLQAVGAMRDSPTR